MRRVSPLIIAVCVALILAPLAMAQRASPHEEASGTIDGKNITIEYGRPYKKGREIFGGLVPWGQVWRTGADEATKFTTDGDLKVGDITVPKGTYSLFTIPNEDEWTLILNKTADQWGAFKYEESTDLGRTEMDVSDADSPVEQFTIEIEGNTLKLMWDQTVASIEISSP